jgi:hypothetical protein
VPSEWLPGRPSHGGMACPQPFVWHGRCYAKWPLTEPPRPAGPWASTASLVPAEASGAGVGVVAKDAARH